MEMRVSREFILMCGSRSAQLTNRKRGSGEAGLAGRANLRSKEAIALPELAGPEADTANHCR